MSTARSHRTILVLVLAVALAAAASGITYAATSGSSSLLKACSNKAGTLRLLQNGKCPRGFSKVSFNARGLTGARGPAGPAGPGTFTVRVTSDSSTSSFTDRPIPGLGLTVHPVCSVGAGASSGLYLEDTTASAGYTVNGSASVQNPGAHAFLVYAGGPHPNLTTGLNLVELTQDPALHANAEFVLQYDSSSGGQMTADVVVTRSGKKASLHLYLDQTASHCVAQAEITPAS